VRRLVGVVVAAALVFVLAPAMVPAAGLPPAGTVDLGAQLMLRLFGETSDSQASFAAAQGDWASESPLRELALEAPPAAGFKPDFAPGSGESVMEDRLALRDLDADQPAAFTIGDDFEAGSSVVHFAASPASDIATLTTPSSHLTVDYQPVPPLPAISPAPGTLAFASGARASGLAPAAMQLGSLHFEGHGDDAGAQTPQLALHDADYGAGANFDVRAGKRNLSLNLSSEYEHVGSNDAATFSVAPLNPTSGWSSWQLPGEGTPFVLPNNADLNRLSLGAGVSVPVLRSLTLNLNYDAQRLYGEYALPGLVNLDTVNNTYGGKLTFNIPQISSSLSIGAYQDRLQNSLLPINGSTQTREDVNFTVKF
jgi:hypothetical protein